MSDLAQRLAGLSPAQRQLLEKRLAGQRAAAEPIAIVGMACRFPGAPDLEAFWRLITDGRDAVVEIPSERWSADEFFDPTGETPGKMSVRRAALVDNPDQFDPQFFGITPREAARMDPQQRLLLEVAWEAMENAGRPADQMAGSRTGVFVGIGGTDYSKVCVPYEDYFQHIDAHMGTGNALSIAANRLSYIFDLHGPSAAVDTACSSSSLAIHFAVESLRRRESDAALAGGVNMILTPETTIAFSKARMLSPTGKCRPFDAEADGYVRGEGCGLILLKRLADAEKDGDQVLAVLRATSVNQDGRTSGISAPNSQSQIACLHAAQRQADLAPDDFDYIEAHGTGTPLGDPIEMQALTEIFRSTDDQSPRCYVTSVKANVGHMETVSGVAGLIKTVLMMGREVIPAQAHFQNLNPHIHLEGTRLVVPSEPVPWPAGDRPRIAGISSFGFGGTNTHLVIEAPGEVAAATGSEPERPLHVVKLSAKSEAALADQAKGLAEHLDAHPDADVADVCYSANTSWAEFNGRAVVVAKDAAQLRERLAKLGEATERTPAGVKRGTVRAITRPKSAFLFTGQGLQYVGMGRGLYESHPTFRQTLEECDDILRELWDGESLLSILYPESGGDDPQALLHQTEFTQPAMFALDYALAELWQSWGVTPDVVLGHSVGEYPAACAAGVMSLEDGLALIAERARLMQSVKRKGRMAVIFAPADRVAGAIGSANGDVVVAVINGPENTVISGDAKAVEGAVAKLEADGVQVKMLNVSHAFHSPLMDEILDAFESFAEGIELHAPHVPLVSNLTGQLMAEAPTARYWRDHLRNAVQFAEGMARIAEAEPSMILEMGPTASLLGMGRRCVPELDTAWLPSLRQGQDDWQTLTASVAEYYVRGGQIDWRGWDGPWPRRRVVVPNYPFQRSRHWFNLDPALRRSLGGGESASAGASGTASGHPLLGTRLSTVWTSTLFEAGWGARNPSYLADHQVQGSPVAPAAAYIEQALAAAGEAFGPGNHGLANLVIQQAMFLPGEVRRRVQLTIAPESGGEATFETYSRPPADADDDTAESAWTMHATGQLVHETQAISDFGFRISDWAESAVRNPQSAIGEATSRDEFYHLMADRRLAYGPAFQVLDQLRRGDGDAVARVTLPESVRRDAPRYHVHPALGDALLQAMAGIVPLEADGTFSPFTYMPVGVRSVRVMAAIDDFEQPLYAYAMRTSSESSPGPERVEGNVYLVDEAGNVIVAMEGVAVQRVGRSAGPAAVDTSDWLYRVAWQSQPLDAAVETTTSAATGAWLILADSQGVGKALADRLAERGQASVVVEPNKEFQFDAVDSANGKPGRHATAQLDPLDEAQYRGLFETAFTKPNRPCLGVVHLWSLDVTDEPPGGAPPARPQPLNICGGAVQLVRGLVRAGLPKAPPLWLVTAGAQSVDDAESTPVAVRQAPLVGLGRVAALEQPDYRTRLVDLDPASVVHHAGEAAVALADELTADRADGEVAYRGGQRYVARLVHDAALVEAQAAGGGTMTIPVGRPFQLRITEPGSFDALRYVPTERRQPEPGQVEIEVRAAGLNFSDVLKALGLYPGIRDEIVPLGIECSGVVTAVGTGVDRFKVGDEVLGVAPYAFGSHALTAEYALVPKPKSIDHDEACTIPITYLTAYYALVHLAHLRPGERLLIHAGAGGVGQAAIQIAQEIGAEIFTTAGSDEKRDFLRSLGVEHVYNSRGLEFADEILADTGREGVDVVLNSLPGEAITKSLGILRAYGRFLEIGKIDIYQNRMIGLLPFQDNLSYFAIDLDRMLRQRPEEIRRLFAELMQHFESGAYRPLMFTRFETEATVDAFRYMSQRKNIGKVVVAVETQGAGGEEPGAEGDPSAIRDPQSVIARRDGTYLITGGLGALGLRVAEWLAGQGAGTIALMSRRRKPLPEIEDSLAPIRAKGAKVVALAGDVADAKSLAAALAKLPKDAPPLRGVVHAAGVLADGVLVDMTQEQLDLAMRPKLAGAWNLHNATREMPLDWFVMFSSVASVLGSPGQANYAAGNAALDALAHHRRAIGLPALAINWGPWAESGMAAEAGRDSAVQSRGMNLIPPGDGLDLLGKLLRTSAPQVAVMDVQWNDMLKLLGSRRPELLADIAADVDQVGGQAASRVDHEFRQRLVESDDATRRSLVTDYIREELARIMGVEPDGLETDQPLSTFGLDSLLALELKNNLEGRLDFTLPMAKLMEGPSIASLATETARLVVGGGETTDGEAASAAGERWTPLLALRAGGDRPPLVLLPALGGDVRCYADLVQQLGDDQPVYAFRPRGADEDLPPHLSMDEMIADYAAALRKLQPEGPYQLAGWSTGGIYAMALAEALETAGDEVSLVALVDTPLPSICEDVDVEDDTRFLCDLVNFANCFAGTRVRVDYEELMKMAPDERFQSALAEARRQGTVPAEAPESYIRRLVGVGEANVRVIQGYEPRPVRAAVHLFLPETKGGLAEVAGRDMPENGDHGWRSQVGQELHLHQVSGDHFTMMVGKAGAKLARQLATLLAAPCTTDDR